MRDGALRDLVVLVDGVGVGGRIGLVRDASLFELPFESDLVLRDDRQRDFVEADDAPGLGLVVTLLFAQGCVHEVEEGLTRLRCGAEPRVLLLEERERVLQRGFVGECVYKPAD